MKKTPWFPANTHPVRRGWYERDHRQVDTYIDDADRCISLDMWEPVDDPYDTRYPGVWHVKDEPYWITNQYTGLRFRVDGLNDASQQYLPWRGVLRGVR